MSNNDWREIRSGATGGVEWRLERRDAHGINPAELRVVTTTGAFPVAIVHATYCDVVREALAAKPEKPARGPIVGWRVRVHIGGVGCEYVDFSSGDPDGWSDVDGKPKPMPRSDALRLRRTARRWADRIGSSWEFRLHPVRTRPTRRGGGGG